MRIIAGTFRGRPLRAPRGTTTRPTSGRVREAVFNHLAAAHLDHDWTDLRVLDLFAGSGALGLEALSRGAAHTTFVDRDQRAVDAIRANITSLGLERQTRVIKRDADRALGHRPDAPFDLIFVDPPYALVVGAELLAGLADDTLSRLGTLAVIEHAASSPPEPAPAWEILATRPHGDTTLTILRRTR